jgi:hypothetical protein
LGQDSTWGDVQEMAQSGQFAPGYIEAVIRDSDRLSEIQKITRRGARARR